MTLDELRALATVDRGGYHAFSGDYTAMAPALEDVEFLYALVRSVKPLLIVETGTGLGVSARFMAEALVENGRGHLMTAEPRADLAARARELLAGLPCDVGDWPTPDLIVLEPDLVFLDSGWDRREWEIEAWLSGSYRGLVVVHDANRNYAGLAAGTGVFLPGYQGLWLGRPR